MNVPESVSDLDGRISRPVFVSYATADRKQALAVCKAIESRGTPCWISTRDVAPGANYQEAIVQSIRNARAVVLVFSTAANNSDEIKKELSLASRYRVPVLAVRIEDVEPSDAFAYELSTRQWIDAFAGRDQAIDSLVARIGQLSGAEPIASSAVAPAGRRPAFWSRRPLAMAARPALAGDRGRGVVAAAAPRSGAQHVGPPRRLQAAVRGLARNASATPSMRRLRPRSTPTA